MEYRLKSPHTKPLVDQIFVRQVNAYTIETAQCWHDDPLGFPKFAICDSSSRFASLGASSSIEANTGQGILVAKLGGSIQNTSQDI